MRKFWAILGLLVLLAVPVTANNGHQVTLTLGISPSDMGTAGTGYTIYREAGACPSTITSTAGFTALNSTLLTPNQVTTPGFVDTNVTATSTYCYTATFTNSGGESAPTPQGATVTIPVNPPTNLIIGTIN